ncbi:2-dehydro-3-deoxy-6-phosphogalactonate aldolase [Phytohalomonas tamaricis]|uniref:2-dehydro-3-deoxy-6-phosphogalactonate aldolase n=1 Tax=Phytohalomonas tamaricis TaxID=2081032 RepID=UPI000D0B7BA0|nr:2-dehydro-3-deoxy-6-phosphogalactonate aldolase [Phytohalomonas tamaricis]
MDLTAFDNALRERPLVAILRGIETREIDAVADELIEAGIRLIEVPLNSPTPWESIERLVERAPADVAVGAGTVLTVDDVDRLAACGATLMVTPNTDIDVVSAAARHGLGSLIGVATASEAFAAIKHGARGLKLFPAGRLGPGYLKDLKSVLPVGQPIMAVGGINHHVMAEWHVAGVNGFGFGSNLYTPGKAAREVGETARELVNEWVRLEEQMSQIEGLYHEFDQ